jgi:hypothetical protein
MSTIYANSTLKNIYASHRTNYALQTIICALHVEFSLFGLGTGPRITDSILGSGFFHRDAPITSCF